MVNEKDILEATYFDTCTVERKQKIKNPITGVTEATLVKVYENIKCALSKMDNQIIENGDTGKLIYNHKLFHNPKYDILKGDIVTVSTMGKISVYLASEGFSYPSHIETILSKKERV